MNQQTNDARLRHLMACQNADGAWGHYPGKASWLEPSVYAAFACSASADAGARAAASRAFDTIASWQRADGAWNPSPGIDEPHWSTSLAVLAGQGWRGALEPRAASGVNWLLKIQGNEGGWLRSVIRGIRGAEADQNEDLHGWPWRDGNSSWVEPSSYALMALRRGGHAAHERVRMAEAMILDRRCIDHGWNYGNKRVYKVTMPSYGETTAIALLGLQGHPESRRSVGCALSHWKAEPIGLARAWLAIALRAYGALSAAEVAARLGDAVPAGGDITLAALESIALSPDGGKRWFGARENKA